MSSGLVVLAVLLILFIFLIAEVPVALSMAGSGAVGIVLLRSSEVATDTFATVPFSSISNYTYAAIPMYILMGMLALHGKLGERLYSLAGRALKFLPGGLGIATVCACAGFAAVSGSSIATAATVGKLASSEMRKAGYSLPVLSGTIAAAGTLGVLIPPSILLVIYSVMAQVSIAKMLVAGIIPGILIFLIFSLYLALKFSRDPEVRSNGSQKSELKKVLVAASGQVATEEVSNTRQLSPGRSGVAPASEADPSSTGQALALSTQAQGSTSTQQARAVLWIVAIFSAVMLGMFTGLFTVVESSAIAAALALIMVLVESKKKIRPIFLTIWKAAQDSVATISMALILVVGASIFSRFLIVAQVPSQLTQSISTWDIPPTLVVVVILLLLIPLGMFLESMSIILVVVPLVAPVVAQLGFDPIWFGILFVILLEIGLITPPLGMNVFVTASAADVPIGIVFRGAVPFVMLMLLAVGVLFLFPDLVTFLPNLFE